MGKTVRRTHTDTLSTVLASKGQNISQVKDKQTKGSFLQHTLCKRHVYACMYVHRPVHCNMLPFTRMYQYIQVTFSPKTFFCTPRFISLPTAAVAQTHKSKTPQYICTSGSLTIKKRSSMHMILFHTPPGCPSSVSINVINDCSMLYYMFKGKEN